MKNNPLTLAKPVRKIIFSVAVAVLFCLPSWAQTNLALSGTATQSSTIGDRSAELAIDGNLDTSAFTYKQRDPKWYLTLKDPSFIDKIVIWKRPCCPDDIWDLDVLLYDSGGRLIAKKTIRGFSGSSATFNFTGSHSVKAKKITVVLMKTDYLIFAEVQVFGSDNTLLFTEPNGSKLWDFTTPEGSVKRMAASLSKLPQSNVTYDLTTSQPDRVTVHPTRMTLGGSSWSSLQPFEVRALNDPAYLGNVDYQVLFTKVSGDIAFSRVITSHGTGTLVEQPSVGYRFVATDTESDESGGTAALTMRLETPPSSTMTVRATIDDAGEAVFAATGTADQTITFTASNWSSAQSLTINGVDDDIDDGDIAYNVSFAKINTPGEYSNAPLPGGMGFTNRDHDTAAFNDFSVPVGAALSEDGGSTDVTLSLATRPTAAVNVIPSANFVDEVSFEPATLVITPDEWNALNTLRITGRDDNQVDGNIPVRVSFTVNSVDSNYASATPPNAFTLVNADDDSAGYVIKNADGSNLTQPLLTDEGGGRAVFSVSLLSEPASPVTIGVAVSDTGEVSATPAEIKIDASNWNALNAFTLTGLDDTITDLVQSYDIRFTVNTADSNYSNLLPPNTIFGHNADDDAPDYTVVVDDAETDENGGTATIRISLKNTPLADVTLAAALSDTGEAVFADGGGAFKTIVFTPANWASPQALRIRGVADSIIDGDQPVELSFAATNSKDVAYAAAAPPDPITVVNTDNDSAGLTLTHPSDLTVGEDGRYVNLSLALASRPSSAVTVGVALSDATEAVLSVTSIVIEPDAWNALHAFRVTGVSDGGIADGDRAFKVSLLFESDDENYNDALPPQQLSFVNVDMDSAGITVKHADGAPFSGALQTGEAGAGGSFYVSLTSVPIADVTLNFNVSQTGEATVLPTTLTLSPSNYDALNEVRVTGVNDDVVDGNRPYEITAVVGSAEPDYDGFSFPPVSAVNIDDDSAGYTIVKRDLTTGEDGASGEFDITLTSEPATPLSLKMTVSNAAEALFAAGNAGELNLMFTAENWNAPKTVRLNGVEDNVVDGNRPFTVRFVSVDGDAIYKNTALPADIAFTNMDNDTAGFAVGNPATGVLGESGVTGKFTLALTSQPLANVVFTLGASDASEATVSPSLLTVTPEKWNALNDIVVTGLDDAVADGTKPVRITFSVSSTDVAYANTTPPEPIAFTNPDDDSAGYRLFGTDLKPLGARTLEINEGGSEASFYLKLNSEPSEAMTLDIVSGDPTEGEPVNSRLVLEKSNWNSMNEVRVRGVADFGADGDRPFKITLNPVAPVSEYAHLPAPSVSFTNLDNPPGFILDSTATLTTVEDGTAATVRLKLKLAPNGDVKVIPTVSDAGEATVSPQSVTFSSTDWDSYKTITLTGVDDRIADGSIAHLLKFTVDPSSTAEYKAVNPPKNIETINVDNDSAGYVLKDGDGNVLDAQTVLETTENGGGANVYLSLTSEPSAPFSLDILVSEPKEGDSMTRVLTLDNDNWNADNLIAIRGVDDFVVDGSKAYDVSFSPMNPPTEYDAVTAPPPSPIRMLNTDNDRAGFVLSPGSGRTSENGATDEFTVTLTSEPTGNVVLAILDSDAGEVDISPVRHTFTADNWNDPATFTLTGLDEAVADGDAETSVTFSYTAAAVEYDPASVLPPRTLTVVNEDNDTAGFVVTLPSPTTDETGGAVDFNVSLRSEPVDTVMISIGISDEAEAELSLNELTFDPSNWDVAQTFAVRGKDDEKTDGNRLFQILLRSDPATDDVAYAELGVKSYNMVNRDNEKSRHETMRIINVTDGSLFESDDFLQKNLLVDTGTRNASGMRFTFFLCSNAAMTENCLTGTREATEGFIYGALLFGSPMLLLVGMFRRRRVRKTLFVFLCAAAFAVAVSCESGGGGLGDGGIEKPGRDENVVLRFDNIFNVETLAEGEYYLGVTDTDDPNVVPEKTTLILIE